MPHIRLTATVLVLLGVALVGCTPGVSSSAVCFAPDMRLADGEHQRAAIGETVTITATGFAADCLDTGTYGVQRSGAPDYTVPVLWVQGDTSVDVGALSTSYEVHVQTLEVTVPETAVPGPAIIDIDGFRVPIDVEG